MTRLVRGSRIARHVRRIGARVPMEIFDNMTVQSRYLRTFAAIVVALAMAGCATTQSTKAKSLKGTTGDDTSVAACRALTVMPFTVPADSKATAATGELFADDIAARLKSDFGPLFESVASGSAARGVDGECFVQGAITKYKPGSRVARFILIGLGAAHFEGNVKVTDAMGGRELMTAPFDKLWAFGGVLGVSKGIENMERETAAAVAGTIARAKGWEPPAGQK